jgi:DNA-binding NtrC family response regulator
VIVLTTYVDIKMAVDAMMRALQLPHSNVHLDELEVLIDQVLKKHRWKWRSVFGERDTPLEGIQGIIGKSPAISI